MGRIDLLRSQCPECKGDGKDPKKKKRMCPVCHGGGWIGMCPLCKKPAGSGGKDASGNYRIKEDEVCKCYEGLML